ncbi:MAG: adenine phosphoribosyltransferase [Candidatus Schekmanbacteria bacterium RBG_13_48_7]|uniref:Adenine phosphoribosyltransferase n=1 Tax=Candidatus Schekmanbacteria bacterium RBG_13_48_7 TaxID=1817878 RepID=A0A1F7RTI3_9BACT|nr:MAG: adenine phosphoribosyltransferase [Candidatus Schekmanbacteria bacterium RBG_13_48_7]
MLNLADYIRDIPDFPKPGIIFKDITPLLKHGKAFKQTIDELTRLGANLSVDKIVGTESRGFIFAAPVAYNLGIGFIPVRKPNKLPHKTRKETYSLEYGTDSLEIHEDAVSKGERVLIIDDLLATGGTIQATAKLVESSGAIVAGFGFLIELTFLHGIEKLKGYNVNSLIKF